MTTKVPYFTLRAGRWISKALLLQGVLYELDREEAACASERLSGRMEEVLNTHVKEYKIKCLACLAEMQKVWQDLEVSESARQIEVSNAIAEACGAWSNALTRCAHQRAEVAAHVSSLLDQASMIAEELGEGNSTRSKVDRQRTSNG